MYGLHERGAGVVCLQCTIMCVVMIVRAEALSMSLEAGRPVVDPSMPTEECLCARMCADASLAHGWTTGHSTKQKAGSTCSRERAVLALFTLAPSCVCDGVSASARAVHMCCWLPQVSDCGGCALAHPAGGFVTGHMVSGCFIVAAGATIVRCWARCSCSCRDVL